MDGGSESSQQTQSQQAKMKDPALVIRSPYYVHPAGNLIVILVTPANYDSESKKMRHALLTKDKLIYVNSKIESPGVPNSLYEALERCNSIITVQTQRFATSAESKGILWTPATSSMAFHLVLNSEKRL